jgi:hypothetical protein
VKALRAQEEETYNRILNPWLIIFNIMIGVTVGNGGNGLRGRATGTDALYQGLPIATMDRCAWIGRASSAVFSDQIIQQDLSSYAISSVWQRYTIPQH